MRVIMLLALCALMAASVTGADDNQASTRTKTRVVGKKASKGKSAKPDAAALQPPLTINKQSSQKSKDKAKAKTKDEVEADRRKSNNAAPKPLPQTGPHVKVKDVSNRKAAKGGAAQPYMEADAVATKESSAPTKAEEKEVAAQVSADAETKLDKLKDGPTVAVPTTTETTHEQEVEKPAVAPTTQEEPLKAPASSSTTSSATSSTTSSATTADQPKGSKSDKVGSKPVEQTADKVAAQTPEDAPAASSTKDEPKESKPDQQEQQQQQQHSEPTKAQTKPTTNLMGVMTSTASMLTGGWPERVPPVRASEATYEMARENLKQKLQMSDAKLEVARKGMAKKLALSKHGVHLSLAQGSDSPRVTITVEVYDDKACTGGASSSTAVESVEQGNCTNVLRSPLNPMVQSYALTCTADGYVSGSVWQSLCVDRSSSVLEGALSGVKAGSPGSCMAFGDKGIRVAGCQSSAASVTVGLSILMAMLVSWRAF